MHDDNIRGAPDLVIEILSPSTADKDRGLKHELYGRYGVTEYEHLLIVKMAASQGRDDTATANQPDHDGYTP